MAVTAKVAQARKKVEEKNKSNNNFFHQILGTDRPIFNVVFENLSTGNSFCCPKIEVEANT